MKISNDVLSILKWMASVNGGINIEPGNVLYSKMPTNQMCTKVVLKNDTFDHKFVTNNLQKFINVVALFDNPDVEFTDESAIILGPDGKGKTIFYQSNTSTVDQSNKVPRKIDNPKISFHVNSEDIQKIFKALSILNVKDVMFSVKDGIIKYSVTNKAVKTSDTFDIIIGECDPEIDFNCYYRKDALHLIPDYSYDVEVYDVGLTKFSVSDESECFSQFDIYCVTSIDEN